MTGRSKKISKNSASAIVIIIAVAIVVAIILILIHFMRGETTTSGQFPNPEASESLTCRLDSVPESSGLDTSGTKEGSTKVIATFNKDKLKSISLTYDLYYNSSEQVESSVSSIHTNLNLATQKEGLGPDIFNLHFTKLTNHLEVRLYADSDDITGQSAHYLLLDASSNFKKSSVEKNFTEKGFKCTTKK